VSGAYAGRAVGFGGRALIAALYIDRGGPYPKMADVDCWDEARDARLYPGPGPVVAHPPCGPWGRLRHLYRGNEHDCGPRAVEQLEAPPGIKVCSAQQRRRTPPEFAAYLVRLARAAGEARRAA
jgi:hypothetical protein